MADFDPTQADAAFSALDSAVVAGDRDGAATTIGQLRDLGFDDREIEAASKKIRARNGALRKPPPAPGLIDRGISAVKGAIGDAFEGDDLEPPDIKAAAMPERDVASINPDVARVASDATKPLAALGEGVAFGGPHKLLTGARDLAQSIGGDASVPPNQEYAGVAKLLDDVRKYTYGEGDLPNPGGERKPVIPRDTMIERIAGGLGESLTSDLPEYALSMAALGPVAGPAMVESLKEKAAGGSRESTLMAGARGGAMGGGMHAVGELGPIARGLVTGAGSGATAMLEGAKPEDALESGLSMGILSATSGHGGDTPDALRTMGGEAARLTKGARDTATDAVRSTAARVKTGASMALEDVDRGVNALDDTVGDLSARAKTGTSMALDAASEKVQQIKRRAADIFERRRAVKGAKQNEGDVDAAQRAAELEAAASDTKDTTDDFVRGDAARGFNGVLGVVGSERSPLVDLTKVDLEPETFQYKRTGAEGVTHKLDDATVFDPVAGGTPEALLYYNAQDRADGQVGDGRLKAVDSHHRTHLAHRLNASVPVKARIIDGSKFTPEEARAIGAIQNIRLGSGTATDAAKLFREMGMTREALRERGLSLSDDKIADALGIAQLEPSLYRKVLLGEMKEKRGAMIGRELPDHEQQRSLHEILNEREKRGPVSNTTVAELIRSVNESPEAEARRSGQGTLGGEATADNPFKAAKSSLAVERAELSASVLDALNREARDFSTLSKSRIAARAKEMGVDLDTATANDRKLVASQIEDVYKKLSRQGGSIAEILLDGARRVRAGESMSKVKGDVYEAARKEVLSQFPAIQRESDARTGNAGGADEGESLFGSRPARRPRPESIATARPVFAETPEAVASKRWFHGTGVKLEPDLIDPMMTKVDNLFSHGFYLTDDAAIAEGYAKARGRKSTPRTYEVEIGPANLLNLEKPAPELRTSIESHVGERDDDLGGYLADELRSLGPDATGEQVYLAFTRAMEEDSRQNSIPSGEYSELVGDISDDLRRAGYDGFTHVGGRRTGNAAHQVAILFDPNDSITPIGRRVEFRSFTERSGVSNVPAAEDPVVVERRHAAQRDEHAGRAAALSDAELLKAIEGLRGRAADGEEFDQRALPVYQREAATRLKDRGEMPRDDEPPPPDEPAPPPPAAELTSDERGRIERWAKTLPKARLAEKIDNIRKRLAEGEDPALRARLEFLEQRELNAPPPARKPRRTKTADPERVGKIGGVTPEDEPVGADVYSRRDGRVDQESDSATVRAAPGQEKGVERPAGKVDGMSEVTGDEEPGRLPVIRTGSWSLFGARKPSSKAQLAELVRRSDIVRGLAERLNVPIRVGRVSMRRALGIFKVRPEVIRTQLANDLATVAHEIGHFIDKRVFSNMAFDDGALAAPAGRRMHGLQPHIFDAFLGELAPIATMGNPGTEGFAEFVSKYVVDPVDAARRAPKFYKFFEDALAKDAPEVQDALSWARSEYQRYIDQPATAKALSMMSIGDPRDKGLSQRDYYHFFVDDLVPLQRWVEAVAGPEMRNKLWRRQQWSNIDALDDPYTLRRLLSGWVPKANSFIQRGSKGVLDAKTMERILPPLEETLDPITDYSGFRAYLLARRTLEVTERDNRAGRMIETGLDPEHARAIVAEQEAKQPEIARVFRQVVETQDAALQYAVDHGVISPELHARFKPLNRDYVPLHRVMEDDVEAGFKRSGGGGNSVVDLANPIYRLKGSHRDIVDPLESIIKNIYTHVYLAERNQVGQALVRLANKTHGSGMGVEIVPEEQAVKLHLSPEEIEGFISKYTRKEVSQEVSEALSSMSESSQTTTTGGAAATPAGKAQALVEGRVYEALKSRGFSDGEASQMIERIRSAPAGESRETIIKQLEERVRLVEIKEEMKLALPEEAIPVFRPDIIKRGEPIVAVFFKGKPTYVRLSPEIYETMKGLDSESAGIVVRALAPLARGLRAGVVLSPEFAGANIAKDQITALLQSRTGYVPVFDLIRGIGHLIKNDEVVKDFYLSGAAMSEIVTFSRKYMQKTARDVIRNAGGQVTNLDMEGLGRVARGREHVENFAARRGAPVKGVFYLTHPIEALRVMTELSDNATRLGEFARTVAQQKKQNPGISRRELLARGGINGRDVTIDFQRAGAGARAINQSNAFWNVAVQGPDRMLAAFKRDPVGFSMKALVGVTLPAVMLWAKNKDDPRYRDLPEDTKNLNFIIPTGTVTADEWDGMSAEEKDAYNNEHPIYSIPKAYEPGLIFGSFVERFLDYATDRDPEGMKRWAYTFLATMSPSVIPTAIGPVLENAANFSFFRGAKLVPRSLEDASAISQRTAYTSETANAIASAMNEIPMPEILGKTIGFQSPIKVENMIRGYTGGMGRLGSNLADVIIRQANSETGPETVLSDIPIIRRFVRRYPTSQSRQIEDFYQQYQKSLTATRDLQLMTKAEDYEKADKFEDSHRFDLENMDILERAAAELSDERQVADGIRRNDDLTPRQKRAGIDATTFRMIALAKETNDYLGELRRREEGMPLEETEPPEPLVKGTALYPVGKVTPAVGGKVQPPPDATMALRAGQVPAGGLADIARAGSVDGGLNARH